MKTEKRVNPAPKLINGKHPLVVIRDATTLEILYRALGHANHTSVSAYVQRARKDKRVVIPAEWCLTLSRLSGIPLSDLRPDVYLPEHKVKRIVTATGASVAKAASAPKAKRKAKPKPEAPAPETPVDSTIGQE